MTPKSNGRYSRGMALITALIVITLLTMLLGAFFSANQAQMALLKSTQQSERYQRTSFSVAQYFQSRLENNTAWPESSDDGTNIIDDVVKDLTWEKIDDGIYSVRGIFKPEDAAFIAVLHNNLVNDGAMTTGSGSGNLDTVPPESCRIQLSITESRNINEDVSTDVVVRNDYTFRKAAYIDSTMVASEGIFIDTDKVVFDSNDEIRNQIRSLEDVNFATLENLGFGETESAAPGVVWARGEIYAQGERIQEALANDTLEAATEAGPSSKSLELGRFMENAVGEFTKPDFSYEDVKGVGLNEEVSRPKVELPDGVFEFSKVSYLEYNGEDTTSSQQDILIHRASSDPDSEILGVYAKENAFPRYGAPDGKGFSIATGLGDLRIGGVGLTRLGGKKESLATVFPMPGATGDTAYAPTIDFDQRTITFAKGADYTVKGDFGVTTNVVHGYKASYAGESLVKSASNLLVKGNSKPKLILGGDQTAKNKKKDKSQASERTYLEVNGDLDINGTLTGFGNIVGDDITFEFSKAELAADSETDFAIFSKGSILVRGDNDTGEEVNLKGLLYAEKNVVFDFSGENVNQIDFKEAGNLSPSATKQGTLKVEGAVVSENGHLAVRGVEEASFTYEPKYLDNLFVTSNQKMRLEPLSWWPR